MRVLIACEESQVVCIAFRALGHEAYSCDIQEPSGGHPEWHILGDALKAIEGGQVTTMDGQVHDVGRWDMIIAFPPCTKTSNAGARHLYKGGRLNLRRYYEGLCGKALFLAIWAADCDKVIIQLTETSAQSCAVWPLSVPLITSPRLIFRETRRFASSRATSSNNPDSRWQTGCLRRSSMSRSAAATVTKRLPTISKTHKVKTQQRPFSGSLLGLFCCIL